MCYLGINCKRETRLCTCKNVPTGTTPKCFKPIHKNKKSENLGVSAEFACYVQNEIDAVCKFVAAYEKHKYNILQAGGTLQSVNCFMVDYCQRLRHEST